MRKRFVMTLIATVLLGSPVLLAQTSDEETPPNEGVCDGLVDTTPGLYGLCVAFCEAQDCEATLDPVTDEVTYDPDCRPSSPKLLANYTKRAGAGGPPMPCVNVVATECPCWTEAELDQLAPEPIQCFTTTTEGRMTRRLMPGQWNPECRTRLESARAVATDSGYTCTYIDSDPCLTRQLSITAAEFDVCKASIAQECSDRGR